MELGWIDFSKTERNKILSVLDLLSESGTLDELGKITRIIFQTLIKISDEDKEDIQFLENVIDLFLELSIIRNACAHGNPLIPLILDDNYGPNYLFDLSSVYPEFNSGESVKDWKLFEPLRWTCRMLSKGGEYPIIINSPFYTGLYTAKYILINPSRRSFFSLLFILEYYFSYITEDKQLEFEFKYNFNKFIPIFDTEENDVNNILSKYPKENPVVNQIYAFIYPIYAANGILLISARAIPKGSSV